MKPINLEGEQGPRHLDGTPLTSERTMKGGGFVIHVSGGVIQEVDAPHLEDRVGGSYPTPPWNVQLDSELLSTGGGQF